MNFVGGALPNSSLSASASSHQIMKKKSKAMAPSSVIIGGPPQALP